MSASSIIRAGWLGQRSVTPMQRSAVGRRVRRLVIIGALVGAVAAARSRAIAANEARYAYVLQPPGTDG